MGGPHVGTGVAVQVQLRRVEHGGGVEDAVHGTQGHQGCHSGGQHHLGMVGQQCSLGLSGGPRGIDDFAVVVFVDLDAGLFGVARGHDIGERIEAVESLAPGAKIGSDLVPARLHFANGRLEDIVEDHCHCVTVAEDLLGLAGGQAEVDRHGHGPGLDDSVESEHEQVGVVHPHGHLVPLLYAGVDKRMGNGVDPLVDLLPGLAVVLENDPLLVRNRPGVTCNQSSEIHGVPPCCSFRGAVLSIKSCCLRFFVPLRL